MNAWWLLAALVAGHAHDPSAHPDERAPVERLEALPSEFVGRWEPDVTTCASRSDGVLDVTPSHLTFHESRGRIHAVVKRGTEFVVILEMTDEGDTWLDTLHFRLLGDALYQFRGPYDADIVQRQRCPPGDLHDDGDRA
jgi:hypothetical protein